MSTTSTRKSKKERESLKRWALVKASIPLVVTMSLVVVLFFAVLLPRSTPEQKLYSALRNTLDTEKYTSFRYSGVVDDSKRGIRAEYSGQQSPSGNREFSLQFSDGSKSTSADVMSIGGDIYTRLRGTEHFDSTLGNITGIKKPSTELRGALTKLQDTWIRIPSDRVSEVSSAVPCFDSLPVFWDIEQDPKMLRFPLDILGPPLQDGSLLVYKAKIDSSVDAPEVTATLSEFTECIEYQYAEQAPGLREVTSADVDATSLEITVDTLSNTLRKVTINQIGFEATFVLDDLNKDIAVIEPTEYTALDAALARLTPEELSYIWINALVR